MYVRRLFLNLIMVREFTGIFTHAQTRPKHNASESTECLLEFNNETPFNLSKSNFPRK